METTAKNTKEGVLFYTIESLKKINSSYDSQHGVTERDVKRINSIIEAFNEKLSGTTPIAGDKIICEGYNSHKDKPAIYNNGHIENLNAYGTKKMYVCVSGGSHVTERLSFSTSGGYWICVDSKDVTFSGYSTKLVWTWGWNGACGNGGIYFEIPVKVWYYKNLKDIY